MFFFNILTKKLNKSKDRELPPDDEHLINPADIPTVAPKFVKIVDQWKSRSGSGDGDHKRDSGGLERAQRKPYPVSSTSNIHLDESTVSKPNLKAMLKCLALAIYFHINKRNKDDEDLACPEIFDERIYPLAKDKSPKVF